MSIQDQLKITTDWQIDDYPYLDHYGKTVDKIISYKSTYIDRKNKLLVDPKKEIIVEFHSEDAYNDHVGMLEHYGIHFADDCEYDDEGEIIKWYINHDYFEELNGYKSDYNSGQCQYIISNNYSEAKEREEYDCVIQDAQLLEDYYMGRWVSEILTVKASLLDVELACYVTSGYDKIDDVYKRKEEEDVIAMVKTEAIEKLLELQAVKITVGIVSYKE